MEPTLTAGEQEIVRALTLSQTYAGDPNEPTRIRTSVLRSLVLGLPLPVSNPGGPKTVPLHPLGFALRFLEIVDDAFRAKAHSPSDEGILDDAKAELHLEDACLQDGKALPPLKLEFCFFRGAIRMSRARFRSLSLKGSCLTHLRANGLHVEGTLNLSHLRSAQDVRGERPYFFEDQSKKLTWKTPKSTTTKPPDLSRANPYGDPEMPTVPARRIYEAKKPIPRVIPHQQLPAGAVTERNVVPSWALCPKVIEAHELQKLDGKYGLCWLSLRNCRIGIDLDVSSSLLVAPLRDDSLINSAHARHALDLRGAHVRGRFTFSPAHLKNDLFPGLPFVAIGGISMVRARIDGSVCGSGAQLLAADGSAFAAQRATIGGHLFLDYSWEGQKQWTPFRASGFVDIANASIGSNLYMDAAQLTADDISRAGLIASQATIGKRAYLRGAQDRNQAAHGRLLPFRSAGGVSLDRATIEGDLDMNGACLHANSFGKALYARNLTVKGTARFSTFPYPNRTGRKLLFTAFGKVTFEAASFEEDLNMWGCGIFRSDPEVDDPLLNANLVRVKGSLRLGSRIAQDDHGKRLPVTMSVILGSVWMRSIHIGLDLSLEGAYLASSTKDNVALDLDGATIESSLRLCSMDLNETLDYRFDRLRFVCIGSVLLQNAMIGDVLDMRGAHIRPRSNPVDFKAIQAANITVKSKALLGPEVSQESDDPLSRRVTLYAEGCVDIIRATTPVLLMTGAEIVGTLLRGKKKRGPYALLGHAATIAFLKMDRCRITGHIKLKDISCSHDLHAADLRIRRGALDLKASRLASLKLKDLTFEEGVPDPDRFDVLVLQGASITGTFTIGDVDGKSTGVRRSLRADLPRFLFKWGVSSLIGICGRDRFLMFYNFFRFPRWRRKFAFRLGFRETEEESTGDLWQFADLRDLSVGELDDNDGRAWNSILNSPLCLKLEGFSCRRTTILKQETQKAEADAEPDPKNVLGIMVICYLVLLDAGIILGTRARVIHFVWSNPLRGSLFIAWLMIAALALVSLKPIRYLSTELAKFVSDRDKVRQALPWMVAALGFCFGVLAMFHTGQLFFYGFWSSIWVLFFFLLLDPALRHYANPRIDWLDRQYRDPVFPTKDEFTPGVYESLARTFRNEGHEDRANLVLSAKYNIHRKLAPPAQAWLWSMFGACFDYGLSTTYALATLLLCLGIGVYGARYARIHGALVQLAPQDGSAVPGLRADLPQEFPKDRILSVFDGTVSYGSPAPEEEAASLGGAPTASPTDSADLRTPCKKHDVVIYAVETFIPELRFADSRECDLVRDKSAARYRIWRSIYVAVGWIVSSITILTVPGFLRRRAEG